MGLNLKRHETSAAEAVREVSVEIDWLGPDRLVLTYELVGDLSQIMVPVAVPPARTDNLWHHTCLEAFIRAEGAENYIEFNLSPSTAWAAYRFDAYRQGMADLDVPAPTVMTELWSDRLRRKEGSLWHRLEGSRRSPRRRPCHGSGTGFPSG